MSYTTKAKLEKFLDTTISGTDADDFISTSKEIINNITGRNFEADENASARRFQGSEVRTILIDDCIEVTKVEKANDKWGDSLTDITDQIITIPRNRNQAGRTIPIKGVYWKHGRFGTGEDNIENHQVTAKWGYSESAPEDIQFAATVLAAGMYSANRSEGSAESERIGNYSVTYGDDKHWSSLERAKEILNSYKRYEI